MREYSTRHSLSSLEPTSTHFGVVCPLGTGISMLVEEPYTFPLLLALQYGMQNRCIGAYELWSAKVNTVSGPCITFRGV